MRTLTAGKMMRKDPPTAPASITLAEFRRRFPLGSTQRVLLVDDQGGYAGVAVTASAYAEGLDLEDAIKVLAVSRETVLSPEMDIAAVMRAFETTETDELAVTGPDGEVLGLLAEAYVTRRYAGELEKQQLNLYGEGKD